jgi:CheY-like chemotaxis protein
MSNAQRPLLLYVEDEVLIQFLVESTLGEAGYDTLTASNGHEAIKKLASMGSELQGLVTDVDLGDCPDGWQVASTARGFFPALPVVYVSGASAHDWDEKGVPDSLIVEKPFTPNQIVAAMALLCARGS